MHKGILCLTITIGLVVLAINSTNPMNYHLYISMAIVSAAISYNDITTERTSESNK